MVDPCRQTGRKSLILGTAVFALALVAPADGQAACVTRLDPLLAPFATFLCDVTSQANGVNATLNTLNTAFSTQSSAFVAGPLGDKPDSSGGGLWTRFVAGRTDIGSTGSLSATSALPPGLFSVSADSRTRLEFAGFQVGADFARININNSGWTINLGATGGYVSSEGREREQSLFLTSARGRYEVPFFGLYATFIGGNFFADVQVRWDFFNMQASEGLIGPSVSTNFDAGAVSLSSSVGYKIELGSQFFIEPSAGFVYSVLNIDDLPTLLGVQVFDEVKSLLGRAGVRVGTTIVTNNVAWQPFAIANVWHEFADASTSHFINPALTFPLDLSTSRVGTFGQFGIGIAGHVVNTGWFGYVRLDYRTGENVEGYGINAGLRYQWGENGSAIRVRY